MALLSLKNGLRISDISTSPLDVYLERGHVSSQLRVGSSTVNVRHRPPRRQSAPCRLSAGSLACSIWLLCRTHATSTTPHRTRQPHTSVFSACSYTAGWRAGGLGTSDPTLPALYIPTGPARLRSLPLPGSMLYMQPLPTHICTSSSTCLLLRWYLLLRAPPSAVPHTLFPFLSPAQTAVHVLLLAAYCLGHVLPPHPAPGAALLPVRCTVSRGPSCVAASSPAHPPPFVHTPRSPALIGYAPPQRLVLASPQSYKSGPPRPTTTLHAPPTLFPLFSPTTIFGLCTTSCLPGLCKTPSNFHISSSRFRRHISSCKSFVGRWQTSLSWF